MYPSLFGSVEIERVRHTAVIKVDMIPDQFGHKFGSRSALVEQLVVVVQP
jgi:hypothetical protein